MIDDMKTIIRSLDWLFRVDYEVVYEVYRLSEETSPDGISYRPE
jgi:hypothetical protein